VVAPQVVLTPHAGELAALLHRLHGQGEASGAHFPDRAAVEAHTLEAVRHAAVLTEATVLLKGAATLVASPFQDAYSQADGTPWLATAGSGDVLAGIIGALLAQLGSDVGGYCRPRSQPPRPCRNGRSCRRPADCRPGCGRPA
jgi:NAD(P)H-hydrate repair Nnr-like enzyme with NAD(P)H-hydrate dehydratase domain